MNDTPPKSSLRQNLFYIVLLVFSVALALAAILLPDLSPAFSATPSVGEVASQDYRAPRSLTYTSEVLTEERRAEAERSVLPIYTSPNTAVARQQLERLQAALAYITSVRADQLATPNQKLNDLAALEDIRLSRKTAGAIPGLTDSRWEAIQQETFQVLGKVMGSAIRPENLDDARSRIPVLVSLSLPEEQADVVAELVQAFVAPNSEYSESLTQQARQAARQSVEPVSRTFALGQTVTLRGQVLDTADIEALQQLKLIQLGPRWQDQISVVALVLLLAFLLAVYLYRSKEAFTRDPRSLALIALLFLVFLVSARLVIPTRTVIPYLFPLAAYSLTVAALFGGSFAMVSSIPLAILSAYGLPYSLELTLYYTLGSLLAVLALGQARRIISFFIAGAWFTFAGALVILVYRLPATTTDLLGLATLIGAAAINGLASASIALVLQYLLAQFLGMTTPLHLMDLTRSDHPLLQIILRDAPGTYQHGLQVANLSEQAAERVGADPLLIRVGALYHDAGKTLNPSFFIENQVPGFPNPHQDIDPVKSAKIIISHVTDGLNLTRKYGLPRSVQNFVTEHHGTMIARFQYVKAVEAAGGDESKVDKELFRYPGPKPQSRETAILMLADGCEARVRAERPKDEEDLRRIIRGVIDDRLTRGQLDQADLTLRDLEKIEGSFFTTMRSIYHPRVKYPADLEIRSVEEPATTPLPNRSLAREAETAGELTTGTSQSTS